MKTTRLERILALVFLLCAGGLWYWVRTGAGLPQVEPRTAAPEVFSAERAWDVLRRVLPEPVPHAMGSAAGAAVRERLGQELRGLGVEVEVQDTWVTSADPRGGRQSLARVRNLIGHLPAAEPGPEVLLLAHYDSVAAGPGENDDLAGCVAWIEALRAWLAADSRPPVGIWILFSEGEELGLFGARAFAEQHRAMESIGLVINLEARGSSGASRLFETGPGNRRWVDLYARHASRPSASSLSVEVYRRMPNGSDLSVFLERGLAGCNFAYIGEWSAYHSPADRVLPDALGSLQHHGENAMAMLRGLAQQPEILARPGEPEEPDLVHMDVLGRFLLRYTPRTGFLMAVLALALALVASARVYRLGARVRRGVWIILVLVCALALPPLLAWIAHDLLAGSLATGAQKPGPVFWSRQGLAAAFYLAAACLAWVPGTWLPRTLRGPGFVLAWAWLLVLLGLVGSLEIPGAAFPAGLPALGLTAGLALTPVRFWTLVSGFVSLLCLVIWVPLHGALLDAFGFDGAPQVLAPLALTGAGVLPALWTLMRPARTVCAVGAVLTLLLVAGLLHTSGPYTSGRPAKLNVVLSGSALEPQVQIPWPAGIEHRARPEFSELQQWWQADADSAPSAMQWQWLPDPEPGVRRARVTMARGDQALFFEAQETEWIRIAGVQSQPGHGGVWILGAGVEPFELDLPLEPGRQEVHFDCAVGGLPAGLAEWYGALDLPVVPRHRGHEWHVRMQVGLPEVREPDPAVDSK